MNRLIPLLAFLSLLLFCCILNTSAKNSITKISGALADDNALRYRIDVLLAEPAPAYIHFYTLAEDGDTLHRYTNIHDPATYHPFTLVGLRAETTYFYQLVMFDTSGEQKSPIQTFQTGTPPLSCPKVDSIYINPAIEQEERYFLCNAIAGPNLSYYVIDQDGHTIWYEIIFDYFRHSSCGGFNVTANNTIVTSSCHDIEEWTFEGEKKRIFSTTDTTFAIHHDLIKNEAGNYVVVYATNQMIEKYDSTTVNVVGDGLAEINPDGEIIWQWSTFDYLDPKEEAHPGNYWTAIFGSGSEDWTHANSISQKKDGTYLMSLAAKNLILNIDPTNDNIIWSLGDGGTIEKTGDWTFSYQHAFTEVEEDTYLVFDNRGSGTGATRILEILLSTSTNNAALIDEYVLPTTLSTPIIGSAYKHPENGNQLICTGVTNHIIEKNEQDEILIDFQINRRPYRSYYLHDFYPPNPEVKLTTELPDTLCTNSPEALTGILLTGEPASGFFTGNGIRQSEEDGAFYFDIDEAGIGSHTITYNYGHLKTSKTITIQDQSAISITENEGVLETDAALSDYQWYIDGELIEGANSGTYIADKSGDYTVTAQNSNGCQVVSGIYTVIFPGIAPTPAYHSLEIYPNPVQDHTFTINGDFPNNSSMKATIYTIEGKVVQTSNPSFVQGMATLNTPKHPGIYFIELTNEDGQSWWGKLKCW